MNKLKAAGWVGLSMVGGFLVGFAIGQGTRKAAPSNVSTQYDDGVFTIKADVKKSVQQGIFSLLD